MSTPAYEPRVINPGRFARAVVFAADESVRAAADALAEGMPWTKVEIGRDPAALRPGPDEGAVVRIFDDTGLIVRPEEPPRSPAEDTVDVLLTFNELIQSSPPAPAATRYPYTSKADLVFAVDRADVPPEEIIGPAARAAEDLLNIRKYSRERRFIFLIVDDEPRWFSQFLPVLYGIIGQRADVLLARTFEEALEALFGVRRPADIDRSGVRERGRGDDVIGLITDLFFPKGDAPSGPAGRELIELVRDHYPRIPIIVASKDMSAEELKDRAFVLPKGDPGSARMLRDTIHDRTGMGDFTAPGPGPNETVRIRDIRQMHTVLLDAARESKRGAGLRRVLEDAAERDAFSTWFYMHGFRRLGDVLRPRKDRGFALIRELLDEIESELDIVEATPLLIEGEKVFTLDELAEVLRRVEPARIQDLSDRDVFSTWLERKGYPELADELRPIHGSGEGLREVLARTVEKWIAFYGRPGTPV
jgi:hypothetical protein